MLARRHIPLVLLVGLLAALEASAWEAGPETVVPEHLAEGFDWEPQPVRAPVAPERVRGVAPFVPEEVPGVTGPVRVGPEHGAAFWLEPLEVVRVTGEAGALRFVRVPGTRSVEASSLRLEEPGLPVRPGRWYLAEPIGGGSMWVVLASRPGQVRIERPTPPRGALHDEALRVALLRWVEGERQELPPSLRAEVRARLEVEARLAEVLARGVPEEAPLHRALRDWRKASALRAWSLHQSLHASNSRLTRPRPPGVAVSLEGMAAPFFQPPGDEGAWKLELEGPGVLALEVRPLLRSEAGEAVVLEVGQEGRAPQRLEVTPRPAFPSAEEDEATPLEEREPRRLDSGVLVGAEEELRVPLPPGRHAWHVRWRGGPLLLRAQVARRRPWVGEALAGESHWPRLAERAWKRVEADDSPRAALLRRQLAALLPELATATEAPPSLEGLAPELRALLALEEAEAAEEPGGRTARAEAAREALLDEEVDAGSVLAWHLRLRLARLLLALPRPDAAQEVLRAAPSFPDSAWQAMEAAEVVSRLPLGHPLRSRQLAALELAWRREPLSDEIRRRYRAAWWRASRWGLRSPLGKEAPPPRRWLDIRPLSEGGNPGPGALWPLRPDTPVHVRATAPGEEPTVLQAYVLSPPGGPRGPLVLHVGPHAFPLPPLARVEPVEVALPPGEHLLRLEADASARAFLSLPPSNARGTPEELGYVHTQWPVVANGKPVRFRVPDAHLPSPVRVLLRTPGASEGPVTLWLHTDIGSPRRMVLEPGRASSRHLGLEEGAQAPAPPPASVVVHLPPHAREVWFEPERPDVPVVASLSVRRPLQASEDEPLARPARAEGTPSVETLLELSRRLAAMPEATELLLERAELLLSLAEEGLAREDVERVLRGPEERLTPGQVRHLRALVERLEEEALEPVRFPQPITRPTLLAPGFAALDDANGPEARALLARIREAGVPKALERLSATGSPTERYLRARLLAEAGQVEQAARELVRLYRGTGRPQLGLEALLLLERLHDTPRTWEEEAAPLGSALAGALSTWAELPRVRRMRAASGRWTRWEPLLDAEGKAGKLSAVRKGAPTENDDRVRSALLAPPWPLDEVRLLSAGQASVLALSAERPRRVAAQVLCRPLRAGPEPTSPPCAFALRLDGRTVSERKAAAGELVELAVTLHTPGRHQVEVLLARTEAPVRGLVRFVSLPEGEGEATPLPPLQPLSLLRGQPGAPVVLTVQGPTALRVSARALAPREGQHLLVQSALLGTGPHAEEASFQLRLALPAETDATLQAPRSARVGREGEALLLLPERGAHRVLLEPSEGEALVSVRMVVSEPPAPRQSTVMRSRDAAGLEPLPWPALPPPLSLLPGRDSPGPAPRELGMLSSELTFRHEDMEEGELLERPLRTGLEVRLGLRQELSPRRMWLHVEPSMRLPRESTPVLGSSAALYLTRLPLGLRAHLRGTFQAQQVEEALRYSARGWLSVSRRVPLTPDLSLYPRLGLTLESFHGSEAVPTERFDRGVFWRYGAQHPRRLSPRASLRWQPFQDQVGTLSASATSNADLRTMDHAEVQARWAGLLGGPLPYTRAELGYGLSLRLQDAHRPEGYLRHQLHGRLDWSLWTGPHGRLQLFAEDRLLLSAPFGPQNVFALGLRWDWTGGRGLRDVLPEEEEFERLMDAGSPPEDTFP